MAASHIAPSQARRRMARALPSVSDMRSACAILGMLMVLGCEPASEHASGREDGVRYLLPPGAMQVFQSPDTFEVLAIAPERPNLGGAGQAPCFDPHHAIRARRGSDTVRITICVGCLQLLLDDGRFLPIDPEPVTAAIEAPLRGVAGVRFEPTMDDHGGWVGPDGNSRMGGDDGARQPVG